MRQHPIRRRAFSLLELLIVMGIAALMASIVLGGFSSYQGSQRRSTCQSNMVQIYRAARLYSNDNDSFPLFTRKVNGGTADVKVGGLAMLWGVYDGSPSSGPVVRPPADGALSYLKSSAPLHCPSDTKLSPIAIKDDGNGGKIVDPDFLSYQKVDGTDPVDPTQPQWTYDDVRFKLSPNAPTPPDFARQLKHISIDQNGIESNVNIPTPSSTVVAWCPFHRGLSGKPDTVLFFDGSVRRMEVTQPAGCLPGRPDASGWLRLSECSTNPAANNEGASLAQP